MLKRYKCTNYNYSMFFTQNLVTYCNIIIIVIHNTQYSIDSYCFIPSSYMVRYRDLFLRYKIHSVARFLCSVGFNTISRTFTHFYCPQKWKFLVKFDLHFSPTISASKNFIMQNLYQPITKACLETWLQAV